MIQKPPTTSDKPTDTTAIYSNILKNNFNYKISKKALKEAIDRFNIYQGKKKVSTTHDLSRGLVSEP